MNFLFMDIEYLDNITLQYLAESDNDVRFTYAVSENETLPMSHPDSFHAFFRIEIGYKVRKDDDSFSEIK